MADTKDTREIAIGNKGRIIALEQEMKETKQALIQIRDKLIYRPTWPVLVIVSFLSATTVGLLVAIVKHVL